jgi:rhamnosyltransferase
MATYDGVAHLEAQVASIFAQIGVECHLFARDDGSHDGTPALLDALAERSAGRMTVFRDPTPTGSAAGNFFRLLSMTDFAGFTHVALADQDDVWFPDKLARAVDRMQDTRSEGYSSDLLAYDAGAGSGWMIRKAGQDAALDYLFQGASAGCTYMLSVRAARLVADTLAGLKQPVFPAASHDWTIYAICRSRGLGWVRDPEARIMYRQHAVNVYGARAGLSGLLQRARLVGDRWYRHHVLWLRKVVDGTPVELEVLDALARGRLQDRLMLARRATEFRRTPREATLLRAALLRGL